MTSLTRRSLLAGASGFMIIKPGLVRGTGPEKLKFGLVGCGGRGTEAAINLMTADPNTELVAMGDIFADKLRASYSVLSNLTNPDKELSRDMDVEVAGTSETAETVQKRVKVDPEHRFVGFDAYRKVIASDVDIVLLATPPAYRPEHFEAAVNAGKHCFVEKPIATDAAGVRRFMASVKKADEKKLTVVPGTQSIFAPPAIETREKILGGAIGDIVACYTNNLSRLVLHVKEGRDPKWGDMEWQHREWYSFIWICGDAIVEQHIHGINFCNWVMGTHPERVVASGGVAWRPREEKYGNIHDHIYADYVYPNGVHMSAHCRQYPANCTVPGTNRNMIAGTKGRSTGNDLGTTKGIDPRVHEHIVLVKSVRGNIPYVNLGMLVAESTMTAIMGRESAYSGIEITWDMIMNSKQDLQPKAFDYALKMEVPPVPVPGQYRFV
jgi:predicted dehydrogenase